MSPDAALAFLVTCEHGGNDIPARWRGLFAGAESILASHRGWDPGALGVARLLAGQLAAPTVLSETSRLLVDLNRSKHHPRAFSEWTRSLPIAEREALLAAHYEPHRSAVESLVRAVVASGRRAVHLGVHSFTPVLGGVERRADFALLYDPGHPAERRFCAAWAERVAADGWRVRRNYPYRGTSDGLVTALRRRFEEDCYLGIELEFNHRFFEDQDPRWGRLVESVCRTVPTCLA